MNVSAAADITAPARQCERPGPADGKTDFAQVKEAIEQESAVSTSGTRVFSGASDYILEWAQKYNVHISVTAVPDGENGTYMPALKNEPKLPLVHIHPKALERMENDIEFRNKVENSIRVHSQAMHYITERGGDAIAGTSITIHEDGSVTSAVFREESKKKDDTWAIAEIMIKQAGIICELMHAANVEYTKRYLDSLPKTRAMAEVQRLRVNAVPAPAAMAPAESAAEPENA